MVETPMKLMPDGSLPRLSVGLSSIGIAVLAGIAMLPGAEGSASPILYVIILGGLCVGVPGALGVAIVSEHLRRRAKHIHRKPGTQI
jgi:hypothetical protein